MDGWMQTNNKRQLREVAGVLSLKGEAFCRFLRPLQGTLSCCGGCSSEDDFRGFTLDANELSL